ncbi:MAG: PEP-CTERM sorting domain-containing protein [Cytophagaceae bacterium]|nr:PEP-CTERM sorting domain-containing protein [Gemmatimonadaceae bacterium]
MRFVRVLAAAALTLASAQATAQTANLKFQTGPGSNPVAYGYYVGPFWGTVTSDPTKPKIDLYCVDVLNSITWGKTWSANLTNLASGNLANTRHGDAKLANYQQAAFLATQFTAPGVQTNMWGGIQAAIWNLLNPGQPNGGTNVNLNSTEAYWLAQANLWSQNTQAVSDFDFSRWTIVTDVNAAGNVSGKGTQEFLTTGITPEPETWMLMGTGLFLIVGFAFKRGRMV